MLSISLFFYGFRKKKDFSMLVLKYIQALAVMVDKERNIRKEDIDKCALVASIDGF
jgi:hypothetical protein